MFGFGKKVAKDVPGILEEGRSWVNRLSNAADIAYQESKDLTAQAEEVITTATIEAAEIKEIAEGFQLEASEGHAIASNFQKMLTVK